MFSFSSTRSLKKSPVSGVKRGSQPPVPGFGRGLPAVPFRSHWALFLLTRVTHMAPVGEAPQQLHMGLRFMRLASL